MAQTIFEKIWNIHHISTHENGSELILIDRVLLHERTGGVALKSLAQAGHNILSPSQVFVTMDHVVDTLPGRGDHTIMPTGTEFITSTRAAAKAAGLVLFDIGDPRQGIVHVISPEQGIVLPGCTLVCPDSHTCSQGALGALAWGIGSSEAEHALATMTLRMNRPKTMRIRIDDRLQPGVTAKDLALALLAQFGSAGAKGYHVEFAGEAIQALDIEGRLTLCNLATELSAFSAIIAPDEKVYAYLQDRPYAPRGAQWETALASWRALATDPGAVFDAELHISAHMVRPMVTWGTNPQQAVNISGMVPDLHSSPYDNADSHARALAYMGLQPDIALSQLTIDAAFIGSCTNSRLTDLQRAATILQGRKVAKGVRAICVPGSGLVKAQAEAEGLDKIFLDAGFEWREPGCSMCFFAGGESFGEKQRVITSTNRNFESRQGPSTRSHLASPETVAASAVLGRIAGVEELEPL